MNSASGQHRAAPRSLVLSVAAKIRDRALAETCRRGRPRSSCTIIFMASSTQLPYVNYLMHMYRFFAPRHNLCLPVWSISQVRTGKATGRCVKKKMPKIQGVVSSPPCPSLHCTSNRFAALLDPRASVYRSVVVGVGARGNKKASGCRVVRTRTNPSFITFIDLGLHDSSACTDANPGVQRAAVRY